MIILLFALLFTPVNSCPQSCNPATVSYIIRDESGQVINEAEMQSVVEKLPKTVDNGAVVATQVSMAEDKLHYFWPESVEFPKGEMKRALEFANAAECTLHLTEVTLTFHGKKMKLIFNLDIARSQSDRRIVVDSLPFQEGTFELEMTGWSHDRDRLVPATFWKKLSH